MKKEGRGFSEYDAILNIKDFENFSRHVGREVASQIQAQCFANKPVNVWQHSRWKIDEAVSGKEQLHTLTGTVGPPGLSPNSIETFLLLSTVR